MKILQTLLGLIIVIAIIAACFTLTGILGCIVYSMFGSGLGLVATSPVWIDFVGIGCATLLTLFLFFIGILLLLDVSQTVGQQFIAFIKSKSRE